jgi:hypothetical protein
MRCQTLTQSHQSLNSRRSLADENCQQNKFFLRTSQPTHVAADSISARMVLARSLLSTAAPFAQAAATTNPRRTLSKNFIPMAEIDVDDTGSRKQKVAYSEKITFFPSFPPILYMYFLSRVRGLQLHSVVPNATDEEEKLDSMLVRGVARPRDQKLRSYSFSAICPPWHQCKISKLHRVPADQLLYLNSCRRTLNLPRMHRSGEIVTLGHLYRVMCGHDQLRGARPFH